VLSLMQMRVNEAWELSLVAMLAPYKNGMNQFDGVVCLTRETFTGFSPVLLQRNLSAAKRASIPTIHSNKAMSWS